MAAGSSTLLTFEAGNHAGVACTAIVLRFFIDRCTRMKWSSAVCLRGLEW